MSQLHVDACIELLAGGVVLRMFQPDSWSLQAFIGSWRMSRDGWVDCYCC